MKKRIMAVLVALAVMCFGTTALAAESPTAGTTTGVTTVATDGQEAAAPAGVTANGADASPSTGTSPKTGESTSLALIALLLCGAGAFVSVKKLEEA